ncbi:MAG TPA: HNH endonuclease signature motif containing protein [Baekduia sp.]|nr:HNH endonuclease signature motif containing protein [Baekduia sp.]
MSKGSSYARIARRQRQLVEAYGSTCWRCGREVPTQDVWLDFVIPRERGGRNTLANLRPAHRLCADAARAAIKGEVDRG